MVGSKDSSSGSTLSSPRSGNKTRKKNSSSSSLPTKSMTFMMRRWSQSSIASMLVLLLGLYTLASFGAGVWRVPSVEQDAFFSHNNNNNNENTVNTNNIIATEHHQIIPLDEQHTSDDPQQRAIDLVRHQFPLMVRDEDLEEIDHPGILYASRNPLNLNPKIKVPKFWDSPAYGPGGVRQYLGNYGETLPTPQQAANVGSWHDGLETIYVSVASYRDPECAPTVESILARAKHPQRIRVALIDQRDTEHDPSYCLPVTPCDRDDTQAYCRYRHQIDVFSIDAKRSVGPVFARHLAHRMYRGEYFAMQVDSHVRFVADWDEDLIWQWKSAKNEMAVLTTYLSDIIGSIDPATHKSKHPGRPIMCKSDYEGRGPLRHLRHGQQPEGPAGIKGQPTLHPFWAAGFSFARAHFVVQVPYDQYLPMVFQGEEISMGLRGFTYGYDYYAAERGVCFHMYAIKENKAKRQKVKLFWENAGLYAGADVKAMRRLNGIIGMANDPTDEYDGTDEKKYGLGHIRNTSKFFSLFGIHTDEKRVEDGLCRFVGKPMMKEFHHLLRKNRMGIDYSLTDFHYVDATKKK